MSKFPLIIIALFLSSSIFSQNIQDSLLSVWQDETLEASVRVNAYDKYIRKGFLFSNPDSAFILCSEMIEFCKDHKYLKGEAIGYNVQGISLTIKGNYPQAMEHYESSLKINEEIGNKMGVANTLNNMGIICKNQNDYPKSLQYYRRSLEIFIAIGNKEGMANNLNNIGNIYLSQSDFPNALEYYSRSIKIQEEIGNKQGVAQNQYHIGSIYSSLNDYPNAMEYYERSLQTCEEIGYKEGTASILTGIGVAYKAQGDYPKALDHFELSQEIYEEFGNKKEVARSLNNIGTIYYDQGDYPKALSHFERSLKINEEIQNKKEVAGNLTYMGMIKRDLGDYPNALKHCNQGLMFSENLGCLDCEKKACQCLYDIYKALDNANKALFYHEKIMVLDDSLKTEETAKKLQQIEFAKQVLADSIANAEADRLVEDAHQAEVRKKNKTRNMLAGGGILLLILAGGIYSRLRYTRKAKNIIEKEKDRSNNLLLNILPADIAEELKIHGKAKARDFEMVSILFTDFKGFTEASAKLSAADLVAEINHCFEAFDGIMEKYNVEKIKTIGDAYMAASGLPVPTDDAVKNSVLAALDMQAFISNRKAELDVLGKPAFEMRVGIHTGPIVAGIVGVKKFQYDIWGDTVNTASRMETNGEVGKVNISQATFDLLKDDPDFSFESRGKVQAKGKGEIEMYFVSKA